LVGLGIVTLTLSVGWKLGLLSSDKVVGLRLYRGSPVFILEPRVLNTIHWIEQLDLQLNLYETQVCMAPIVANTVPFQ
jgi:hypothetical protein